MYNYIYTPGDLQSVQLVIASTTTTIPQTHHSPRSVLVEYGKSCAVFFRGGGGGGGGGGKGGCFLGWGWGVGGF